MLFVPPVSSLFAYVLRTTFPFSFFFLSSSLFFFHLLPRVLALLPDSFNARLENILRLSRLSRRELVSTFPGRVASGSSRPVSGLESTADGFCFLGYTLVRFFFFFFRPFRFLRFVSRAHGIV